MIRRAVDAAERALEAVLLFLFLIMVAAIFWQVFARYVLESPTAWSEELARFLMVWVTMLGSALVLRDDEHVAGTLFLELLPAAARRAVGFVRDALILAMAGALAYYGTGLALLAHRQSSPGLNVPMAYPYAAIPLSAVLIALFLFFRRPPTGPAGG